MKFKYIHAREKLFLYYIKLKIFLSSHEIIFYLVITKKLI